VRPYPLAGVPLERHPHQPARALRQHQPVGTDRKCSPVIGCHWTLAIRVQMTFDDAASTIHHSPPARRCCRC
jgi:hypothetical protein